MAEKSDPEPAEVRRIVVAGFRDDPTPKPGEMVYRGRFSLPGDSAPSVNQRRLRMAQEDLARERRAREERTREPMTPNPSMPRRPMPDDVRGPAPRPTEPEADWLTEVTRELRAIRERYRVLADRDRVRGLDLIFEQIDILPGADDV